MLGLLFGFTLTFRSCIGKIGKGFGDAKEGRVFDCIVNLESGATTFQECVRPE